MKRKHTQIKLLAPEIIRLRESGKTRQEIADELCVDKIAIKNWINRNNRKERGIESGIVPRRRGRRRKTPLTSERDKELRIKELEREVDLLRSFLHASGRR